MNESTTEEKRKIAIIVGDVKLTAVMEMNETAKTIMQKMPMTIPMEDLYDREMCYHYGEGAFLYHETRADGYQTGDLIYWPPMGSFVILYHQNGEQFERVQLGHIDSGAEVFETTGSTRVTFEVIQ